MLRTDQWMLSLETCPYVGKLVCCLHPFPPFTTFRRRYSSLPSITRAYSDTVPWAVIAIDDRYHEAISCERPGKEWHRYQIVKVHDGSYLLHFNSGFLCSTQQSLQRGKDIIIDSSAGRGEGGEDVAGLLFWACRSHALPTEQHPHPVPR